MRETFPRPLAIGYLGFDLPILRGKTAGTFHLGSPVSTHSRISRMKVNTPAATSTVYGEDDNSPLIKAWIDSSPENLQKLKNWLQQQGQPANITSVLKGKEFTDLRAKIVSQFQIK